MPTRPGSATVSAPGDREIVITRRFEAPRALVWETITRPEYVLRWWGPSWAPVVTAEIDLQVGGAWRYVCRGDDGAEMGWHGTYREVTPVERVVSTEVFEGFPDAESVNTMTLTEVDGVTTLTTVVAHSSREHRDGHLQSGMEAGMQETFDRLDTLLAATGTPAEQWRRLAGQFTDVARAVPADRWDAPSPCEGWSARDVVVHMVEWMPAFLGGIDIAIAPGPDPTQDPVAAWEHLADAIQAVLDDPAVAAREFTHEHLGTKTVEHAIAMIMVGDVVLHTWDITRATGGDEALPADVVHEMLVGLEPMADTLAASGQYGPRVEVASDADEQTRLLAIAGRRV